MCSIHVGTVSLCEGEDSELCRPLGGDQVSVLIPQSNEKKIGPCVGSAFSFTVSGNKSLTSASKDKKKENKKLYQEAENVNVCVLIGSDFVSCSHLLSCFPIFQPM